MKDYWLGIVIGGGMIAAGWALIAFLFWLIPDTRGLVLIFMGGLWAFATLLMLMEGVEELCQAYTDRRSR